MYIGKTLNSKNKHAQNILVGLLKCSYNDQKQLDDQFRSYSLKA